MMFLSCMQKCDVLLSNLEKTICNFRRRRKRFICFIILQKFCVLQSANFICAKMCMTNFSITSFLFCFFLFLRKRLDAKKITKQKITKLFTNQRAVKQPSSKNFASFQLCAKLVLSPSSVVVLVAR